MSLERPLFRRESGEVPCVGGGKPAAQLAAASVTATPSVKLGQTETHVPVVDPRG